MTATAHSRDWEWVSGGNFNSMIVQNGGTANPTDDVVWLCGNLLVKGVRQNGDWTWTQVAPDFTENTWVPSWNTDSLSFLPIVIYSYMGFELMSSAGGAIKNPKRDVPKMIILAGIVAGLPSAIGGDRLKQAVPILSAHIRLFGTAVLSLLHLPAGQPTEVYLPLLLWQQAKSMPRT